MITYLPIDSITPDPNNPRKHTREQISALALSIRTYDFTAPILVDDRDQIVAGHGRHEAAKLNGLKEVPVIRLAHLSRAQAKAYMWPTTS